MPALLKSPAAAAVTLIVAAILSISTFAIVDETEQAVIVRFGVPQRVINQYQHGEQFGRTGAGIIARMPFVDQVIRIDKRVLDIDLPNQQVLSTDQLRLEVDAFARFRVVDPIRLVVSAGSTERVAQQLQPLFGSSLRNELGKRPFAALLSPERGEVMENIQRSLQRLASQYGVEIVDVRIKHAELPSGAALDSAYEQMRTARRQEAATIRAQGLRDAQIIRANAQAEAARIYAASFNKDPRFYDFYRAMQSYRTTFLNQEPDKGETSIILSPQNSYLREFMGGR
ncbi:protease modulator HflC [Sphingomonas canadensis]|uniref:Protein HflC n=1 Tax=Sphingomonas canadensis TaxID=1219257 RepID=A0ABW3H608_9SPHN|nr:protease modulator HflC [Sphingomonas canadensis]MCW3835263.1 protease modulator HflC [Sphingomonas canadensis]